MRQDKRSKTVESIGVGFFLIIGTIIALFPFYWIVVGSTYPTEEVLRHPPHFIPGHFLWTNLKNLQESIRFIRAVFNSLFVTTVYTIISIFVCALTGYGFAKHRFWGRDLFFFIILSTMMIPPHTYFVPLFKMMLKLGWVNTYQGIILPFIGYPFGIFLMRQNMLAIPSDVLESARIDGCGEFRMFLQIALPNAKPALASLSIYLFLFQWNRFLWPLIMLREEEMFTLPVALATLSELKFPQYGQLLSGVAVSVIPMLIVFIFMQRQFVVGLWGSAIKG